MSPQTFCIVAAFPNIEVISCLSKHHACHVGGLGYIAGDQVFSWKQMLSPLDEGAKKLNWGFCWTHHIESKSDKLKRIDTMQNAVWSRKCPLAT